MRRRPFPLQPRYSCADHCYAVGLRLLAHGPEQAGIIVAFRNQRSTAFARIEEDDPAAVKGQIDRRCQAGGTTADDQAVKLFLAGQKTHENFNTENSKEVKAQIKRRASARAFEERAVAFLAIIFSFNVWISLLWIFRFLGFLRRGFPCFFGNRFVRFLHSLLCCFLWSLCNFRNRRSGFLYRRRCVFCDGLPGALGNRLHSCLAPPRRRHDACRQL
jgi:hypothetical protein